MTSTVMPLESFRNERPYPFCPGCGHSTILDALDAALTLRATPPERVVLVSDIGCSGLSDQYFGTSAFHGLHGRSITYASGIKLARPDLDVVVIMGDGGTGIGGAHLLAAARRNVGITVIVMNNLNFGMTGGQHSSTTPPGAATSTTPSGNLERPLDLCSTVGVNGAAYTWRGTSFDDDLADRMVEAMDTDGFALLDVWELCTAYFVRANTISRRTIRETMDELGLPPRLDRDPDPRPEWASAVRGIGLGLAPTPHPEGVPITFTSALDRRFVFEVAGSAGGKVQSAARTLALAAVASGLHVALRNDYPITVKTGHSASTLVIDRDPLVYSGGGMPDALLVLTGDGLNRVKGLIPRLGSGQTVIAPLGLDLPETGASVIRLDPAAAPTRLGPAGLAPALVAAAAVRLGLVTAEAITAAAGQGHASAAAAVAAGLALAAT